MTFASAWRYEVLPETVAEFERVYGPAGPWAELFARSPGYRGSTLEPDASRPGCYTLTDRFEDEAAYRGFLAEHGEDYDALSAQCAPLWTRETRVVEEA